MKYFEKSPPGLQTLSVGPWMLGSTVSVCPGCLPWLVLNVASLLFYLWVLCILFSLYSVYTISRTETLPSFAFIFFVPGLVPSWKYFFFIGFGSSSVSNVWCVGLCVSVVCVILVLCGWRRTLPTAVASPTSLQILERTPQACGRLPCASDSSSMWLGCSFSNQSLADGHLGHFQSFAITRAAMSNSVHLSFHVFTSVIPWGVDFYERDWWVKK